MVLCTLRVTLAPPPVTSVDRSQRSTYMLVATSTCTMLRWIRGKSRPRAHAATTCNQSKQQQAQTVKRADQSRKHAANCVRHNLALWLLPARPPGGQVSDPPFPPQKTRTTDERANRTIETAPGKPVPFICCATLTRKHISLSNPSASGWGVSRENVHLVLGKRAEVAGALCGGSR